MPLPAPLPTTRRGHAVYLSHGGGPLPLLGDPGHRALVAFMKTFPARFPRPDAILVVSAHWEEPVATLLGAQRPPLLYDYYGFPAAAYAFAYPAPGHPVRVERISALLSKSGFPSAIDQKRGFDHGVFVPLLLMYPEADIPVLQLSLIRGLAPAAHLALGAALRPLLDENFLVIGSGFSFHNLEAFFTATPGAPDPRNDAFQDWLIETVAGPLSPAERARRLAEWESAPFARYCHPRAEHLLPLHVCAGLADAPAETVFDDRILGKRSVAFLW